MAGKTRAAPHNLASRFGERFFVKSRFEKRRNTVCISNFSNRRIGGKDPPKRADTIVRCCPRITSTTKKAGTPKEKKKMLSFKEKLGLGYPDNPDNTNELCWG